VVLCEEKEWREKIRYSNFKKSYCRDHEDCDGEQVEVNMSVLS
jgi:hypothetical protein